MNQQPSQIPTEDYVVIAQELADISTNSLANIKDDRLTDVCDEFRRLGFANNKVLGEKLHSVNTCLEKAETALWDLQKEYMIAAGLVDADEESYLY